MSEPTTCEPKCHAYGIGCACRGSVTYSHPVPSVENGLVEKAAIAGLDASCPTWRATPSNGPSEDDLIFTRAVLEAVADDIARKLDTFPQQGRHTRARWAESWLRSQATRVERGEAR